jgi:uncharacterized protein YndB with AHSA1/START domain
MTDTNRIEKQITLKAARARVWRALTDAGEFGAWFGVKLQGPFAVGRSVQGQITHPGYEHLTMELTVVQMEAERLFSYRWHPYAIDPTIDYSVEPTTLVEFLLDDAPGRGTTLTIVESGFEQIPPARRQEAFRMNDGGWTAQLDNIRRHVEG